MPFLHWTPAKGYGSREGFDVDWIFLHYTASRYPGDLNYLARSPKPACPSCHFYIRDNGDIHQMVRMEDAAWHAGISWTRPYTWQWERWRKLRTNERSVGIEISSLGPPHNFMEEQYQALAWLLPLIAFKFNIPLKTMPDPWYGCDHKERSKFYEIDELNDFRGLLAHGNTHKSKTDPGVLFDWDRIRAIEPLPTPGCPALPEYIIAFGDPAAIGRGLTYA